MPHPIFLFLLPASNRIYRVCGPQGCDSLFTNWVTNSLPTNRDARKHLCRTQLDYIPYQKRNPAAVPRPNQDDTFSALCILIRLRQDDPPTGLERKSQSGSLKNVDSNIGWGRRGRMYRMPCLCQGLMSFASSVEMMSFKIMEEEILAGEKQ